MADKKFNLKESIRKLNEIVDWFENQEEVDVEAGLEKVKEGAKLVKDCKTRLAEVQNEFEKIRKEVKKSDEIESEEDEENIEDVPF
ncbi:MAG: exodeoxyribonuclease VII small subunit [Candidatus Azambacteria bacterium]|nr:exodeoxyribonuclease VII small subunit [Candidatus Azambacteria bacterium]